MASIFDIDPALRGRKHPSEDPDSDTYEYRVEDLSHHLNKPTPTMTHRALRVAAGIAIVAVCLAAVYMDVFIWRP